MATGLAIPELEQLKQQFCNRFAYLPEEQRLQLWLQTVSTLPSNASSPSLAQQVPRSMSYDMSAMTQPPTANLGSMDRTLSAPAPAPLARSASVASTNNNWQPQCDEQSNSYALYSESASMRRQPSLQPTAATSAFPSGMVEYTPDEYVTNCIEHSPLSQPQNPQQLHVQLTPNMQWSQSSDGSISPSTPALMTPSALSSNSMSRQSSFNPFSDNVSMLRLQSDSSSLFQLIPQDESLSFPSDVNVSKSISNCVDNSDFLSLTGPPSDFFLSPASASVALASSRHQNDKPCLAEDMRRSASTSSESDWSSASASSTSSRQLRREREIAAQASRKIAPKANPDNGTKSASSNAQMMQMQSEDGSSKNVGVIPKAPYVRPQHPKIMCPHCNEKPDGFRGTHELERHVARAHAVVRKGYICIDASPNKKFLANCKHCRNKKVYGAYYNAAAHLRRAHFHPKKKGRKGKHDEKRGGIGGGDDPPMDYLKQHWIKEVEVANKRTTAESPDSGSDNAEPESATADNSYSYDMDASYVAPSQIDTSYATQPQPTSDVSDPSQFVDFGMYVNTSEPMQVFDPSSIAFAYDPNTATSDFTTPVNNFEFDAYMTQP